MPTIAAPLADRVERLLSADFHLRAGSGEGVNSHVDLCAMQAVDWLAGSPGNNLSDMPDCACSVIRQFVIRRNDSRLFRDHLDDLKPFLPPIVGTMANHKITAKRGLIVADYAVRIFAPIWLRAVNQEEWATELESLSQIDSRTSALAAFDATRKIRTSPYAYVYSAAYTDAYAAAFEYINVYDYTRKYTSDYADAYEYAGAYKCADAAEDVLRAKSLECLDAMIETK